MDFQDVAHWQNNKLNRKDSSRMGWSDISISLCGPVVEDLRAHFVERWNFIYDEKYDVRSEARYSRLAFTETTAGAASNTTSYVPGAATRPYESYQSSPSQGAQLLPYDSTGQGYPPPPPRPQGSSQTPGEYPPPPPRPGASGPYNPQVPYFPPPPVSRGLEDDAAESGGTRGNVPTDSAPSPHHHYGQDLEREAMSLEGSMREMLHEERQDVRDEFSRGNEHHSALRGNFQQAGIPCQIVRSCTKWSHGVPTEHSIANAYISIIQNSQHFVYIENQFFITGTFDEQKPVQNKVGAAIVERILRAARAGAKYKVIVVMPAVPGFAGDLKDDASLGTRAIMKYQYNSINRGGHSIMEMVANAGFDPTEYIRFYNLRNYDRINVSGAMTDVEKQSGMDYEAARSEHDQAVELPAEETSSEYAGRQSYQQYQQATDQMKQQHRLNTKISDSVSDCYMLGGRDIRDVPWTNGDYAEIDAFVSEELYIHTKVH